MTAPVLQLFYACYFGAMGVSIPFFPAYLRGLGLSGRQIAFMLAVAPVLHLFVPLGWGWLADRIRRPDRVLRVVCLCAFLFLAPLVVVRTMPAMLLLYAAHQAFAVPIIGLTDALALERVRRGADYGRIRVWGSVAFGTAAGVVGPLLTMRGRAGADPLVPAVMATLLGCAFLTSLALRGHGEAERPHARDVSALLGDRRFLFILIVAPLHWGCAAPYHGFLGILFRDRHFPPSVVGWAFVASLVAEIAALYYFRKLRARFALWSLLAVSFAFTAVRWALVAAVAAPAALVALQLVHGLTFGVFWAVAMAWLGECVSPRLRATGQTMFTGIMYGVGNTAGMLSSGALYDAFHGAQAAFAAAAICELLPLGLMIAYGRRLDPSLLRASGAISGTMTR